MTALFSGDIWVLNKIAELANRCGVSPSVANIGLEQHFTEDNYYYSLSIIDGNAAEHQVEAVDRVKQLLGLDKSITVQFPDLEAVEEAVDHALSLAPRARVRDRK